MAGGDSMMKTIVIGGGPAGMIAAGMAADGDHEVLLLEKNEKLGKKLYITGKGRCNITNHKEIEEFISETVRNGRFLYSAYYGFTNRDLMEFLESLGLELKVEQGGRIFPKSDKASDVTRALSRWLQKKGVRVELHSEVIGIIRDESGFVVQTENQRFFADAVIIATGGRSYPSTGSTGAGYRFANDFGIATTKTRPSLCPMDLVDPFPDLSGLTLKNVRLTLTRGKHQISEFGDLLFTHRGISGPIVLTLSAEDFSFSNANAILDLKPAISEETLDMRIVREIQKDSRKQLKNLVRVLLPQAMVIYVLERAKLDPEKISGELKREERKRLVESIKGFSFQIKGLGRFEEAVITRGGIDIKEINPSTMESKKIPGLYFVGEVLDVDAHTGGYNLQIAFSTGVCAGRSAAK